MKPEEKFYGLQYKLVGMILALVAIPIVVITVTAYLINARFLNEQVRISNENAVSKTVMTLEYMLGSLREDTLEIFQEDTVHSYLTADISQVPGATNNLFSYLGNHLSYNKYIEELHLERMDGLTVRSRSVYADLSEEQKDLAYRNQGRLTFVGEASYSFINKKQEGYVFARLLKDSNNSFQNIGYMEIIVPKPMFDDILQGDEGNLTENFLVNDDIVAIASNPSYIGKHVEEIFGKELVLNGKNGCLTVSAEGGSAKLMYAQIDQFGWYLVNRRDAHGVQTNPQRGTLLWMLLLLAVVLFAVSALLARMFSSMILRPLSVIAKSMKELEEKDYNLVIPERGNDEITALTRSFNRMSCRIHELLNDVYLFQIKEKEAQIKALQAYIDPHFLYNTLDTICWMSRMEDAPETGRLVEALSLLFRTAVKTETGMTNVGRELEYTKNYLMIQECRYADSIEFRLEVEPGLEEYQTVNFALQPLIENAIIHGLEPKGNPGHIDIHVYGEGEALIYRVTNDGVDADPGELNDLIAHYQGGQRGLAIAGLNTRIRLACGEEWGLHYENTPSGELMAVVVQPLHREEDPNAETDDCG